MFHILITEEIEATDGKPEQKIERYSQRKDVLDVGALARWMNSESTRAPRSDAGTKRPSRKKASTEPTLGLPTA